MVQALLQRHVCQYTCMLRWSTHASLDPCLVLHIVCASYLVCYLAPWMLAIKRTRTGVVGLRRWLADLAVRMMGGDADDVGDGDV